MYVSVNRVSIGSHNGFLPIRRQAIIETNAELFSVGVVVVVTLFPTGTWKQVYVTQLHWW